MEDIYSEDDSIRRYLEWSAERNDVALSVVYMAECEIQVAMHDGSDPDRSLIHQYFL